MKTLALRDFIKEAKSGFACGEDNENGLAQIRMNNISNDGQMIWDKIRRIPTPKKISELLVEPGDILFNSTNSPALVGKSALFKGYEEPVTFSNHFLRLRVDREIAEPSFVARLLHDKYSKHYFKGMCKQWVNQASISKNDLLAMEFLLPPLEKQKRIAAILDQADELRLLRQRAIERLNELGQAIFYEMFGNIKTNAMNHSMVNLKKCLRTKGGYAFKSKDFVKSGIPVIRIGEVNRQKISEATACYLPVHYLDLYSSYVVKPGSLLMSLTGTTGKDDYGNVYILEEKYGPCFLNQRVALLSPDESFLNKTYLLHFLRDRNIKNDITSASRGIRQANINNNDILELKIPLPSIELQNHFQSKMIALERSILSHHKAIKRLSDLFSSLQHSAFQGQL